MNLRTQKTLPITLFLLVLLDELSYGIIIPIITPWLVQAGHLFPEHSVWRDLTYGAALALFPLSAALSAPLLGFLADRLGRKPILLFCTLLLSIAMALGAFALQHQALGFLLISRALAGMAASSTAVAQAMLSDHAVSEDIRVHHLARIALALTIAMAIGPLLGGLLSQDSLPGLPLWVATGLGVVAFLLIVVAVPHIKIPRTNQKLQAASLPYRVMAVGALCMLCLELTWSSYFTLLPVWLVQAHMLPSKMLGYFVCYWAVWMCVSLAWLTPWGIHRFGTQKVLRFCFLMVTLGSLLAIWQETHSLLGALCHGALMPLAVGGTYLSLVADLANRVEAKYRGMVLGSAFSMLAFAWVISGLGSAWLWNHFPHALQTLWVLVPLLGFLLAGIARIPIFQAK